MPTSPFDPVVNNDLVKIIQSHLPEYFNKDGKLIKQKFGRDIGCSRENVTIGIVGKGCISASLARKVIELSKGKITGNDLLRFIK